MLSITNRLAIVVMPFLIVSSFSCASLQILSPPALENRTLRLSPDIAGFEYQYVVCAKKFLGMCVRKEMKKDLYDLNDVEVRKKLLNMGFVARVRDDEP